MLNNPSFAPKEITKCSNPIQIIQSFRLQNVTDQQRKIHTQKKTDSRRNTLLKVCPDNTRILKHLIQPATSIARSIIGVTKYALHIVLYNQYS
jgi:hypothetical protein